MQTTLQHFVVVHNHPNRGPAIFVCFYNDHCFYRTTNNDTALIAIHRHRLQDINNKKKKMRLIVTDNLSALHQQWLDQDEGALVMHVLSFLDVKSLVQQERVNKTWRKLCLKTIEGKCGQHVVYALSFLDVKSLVQLERVNHAWRKFCKMTINGKCGHLFNPTKN
jgi:hypothetical protein